MILNHLLIYIGYIYGLLTILFWSTFSASMVTWALKATPCLVRLPFIMGKVIMIC